MERVQSRHVSEWYLHSGNVPVVHIYNRAKTLYEMDHPMPSINTIGWAGVFMTPCANFTYVAGLPH